MGTSIGGVGVSSAAHSAIGFWTQVIPGFVGRESTEQSATKVIRSELLQELEVAHEKNKSN
jgi:hypothetical protein